MARRQRLQDGEQIPVHRPSSRGPTSWDTVVPAGPFITFFGKIISGGKRIVNLLRIKDNALEIDRPRSCGKTVHREDGVSGLLINQKMSGGNKTDLSLYLLAPS